MFERDGMETPNVLSTFFSKKKTPDVENFRIPEDILSLENIVNWTSQNPERGRYMEINEFGNMGWNIRLVHLDLTEFIENVYQKMGKVAIAFNQKMIEKSVTMLDTQKLNE